MVLQGGGGGGGGARRRLLLLVLCSPSRSLRLWLLLVLPLAALGHAWTYREEPEDSDRWVGGEGGRWGGDRPPPVPFPATPPQARGAARSGRPATATPP